jgi:hypothetical protein
MKTIKNAVKTAVKPAVLVATEAQNVASIKVLDHAIAVFTRIAGNVDHDIFHKDCIGFRNGLVGVEVAKNGYYVIPKAQNDYIDLMIDKKKVGYRSTRQAIKASIVACFYLGVNGTNTTAYLNKAKQGKTHLEALTEVDWAIIKRDCNKARDTKKKAKNAKTEAVETVAAETVAAETVVSDTTPIKTSVSPSQDRINKAYNDIIAKLSENDILVLVEMLETHLLESNPEA